MSVEEGSQEVVPVVLVGLGPIGQRIGTRLMLNHGVKVVAATDIAAEKVGQPLSKVIDVAHNDDDVSVSKAAPSSPSEAGVAVVATSSKVGEISATMRELLDLGWNIVSSCEQLVFPYSRDPWIASELDSVARTANRTLLSAGINPGFLMDALPLVLSGACAEVRHATITRSVDTNARREPLQKKAGVGMTPEKFRELAGNDGIGHVGLRESAELLSNSLGFEIDKWEASLDPVITNEEVDTGLGRVPAGSVIGQHQLFRGSRSGEVLVSLELTMAAGAKDIDEIVLDGDPMIRCSLEGGVNGDIGTEAVIANLVPVVSVARAGLLTMADVLPLRFHGRK